MTKMDFCQWSAPFFRDTDQQQKIRDDAQQICFDDAFFPGRRQTTIFCDDAKVTINEHAKKFSGTTPKTTFRDDAHPLK